ncbi:hypothetical protein L915_11909 [Phytophthora nicotianae]|nr:hypothetical protein L915_11909 [Phytophthora nicotianae]
MAAFFTRDIVYTYMEEPWYIVPLEMLHGVTYGLLLASLTTYIYDASPKGATGTMIGLLSAFMRGIGAGIASLVGGYIYDDYGARTIWKIGAFGLVPASLLLIGVFELLARRQNSTEVEKHLVDEIDSSSEMNKLSPIQ